MIALNNLGKTRQVELRWIKAHVGYEGNEKADLLAKEGAKLPQPNTECKPSKAEIRSQIERSSVEVWNKQWKEAQAYRMTKQFITVTDKARSKIICQETKYKVSKLIEILTGHNHLNYMKYKRQEEPNALCRLCEEERETSHHLLILCPAIEAQMQRIIGDVGFSADNWVPGDLLKLYDIPEVRDCFLNMVLDNNTGQNSQDEPREQEDMEE